MNYKLRQLYTLFRHDIWRFVSNIWTYRKALAHTYPFDYSGSLYFMREHFKQLEPALRNGHHVRGDKQADKVKTCVLLLDRILECTDQYNLDKLELDMTEKGFKIKHIPKNTEHPRHSTKTYWEVTKAKEKQDWQLLTKMLTKHMRSWWD